MKNKIFKSKWRQMRGAIKEEWGRLTDDEIQSLQGRADRLLGLLEERYGYTRQKAEEEIGRFLKKYGYRRPSRREQIMGFAMRAISRRPVWTALLLVLAIGGAAFFIARRFQAASRTTLDDSSEMPGPMRNELWSTDDAEGPIVPPSADF